VEIQEVLKHVKSTKNTHVYEGRMIPTLYIPKLAMPAGDPPKELVITLIEKKES
jgi:hypothetical protein